MFRAPALVNKAPKPGDRQGEEMAKWSGPDLRQHKAVGSLFT